MINKSLIIILLFTFPLTSLLSIEILLKTGEVFICDQISEDEKSVKVNWKEKIYIFPKIEIQSIDYNKHGSHISYRYSTFVMRDGSQIKGVVADQDKETVTLKTDVGFLTIEKANIARRENDSKEEVIPLAMYAEGNARVPETRFGISGSLFVNNAPVSNGNPLTTGAGWFVEPAFFGFGRNGRLGYKGEYLVSKGKSDYDFFNNFVYLQYNLVFSRYLDFYINGGLGFSYVRFIKDRDTIAGIDPATYVELGYQGLRYGNYFVRIGARYTQVIERGPGLGMGGAEISVGYIL